MIVIAGWLADAFAYVLRGVCDGNIRTTQNYKDLSVHNYGGRILFIIGQAVLASMSTATGAQDRTTQIAEFRDVAQKAGLTAANVFGGKNTSTYILESTGTGVAIFDYDNDGWEDLYVTYYGKNRLYHNVEGKFEEVGENAGVAGNGKTWGSGCAFVDYDRDGYLDLMVANYADFDLLHPPAPGKYPTCLWKGIAVFCGPRGLR